MRDDELEKLDLNILKILSDKGRISHRSMAAELEKSHLTIKKHIGELEKKKIIKGYYADIDHEKLGYDIIAIIELTISKGKMLDVENKLAENPHIFGVYDVTGAYDALILARFKSRGELSEMIKEIHTSPYIEGTNTHIVLNIIKESSSFLNLIESERKK